MRMRSKTSGKSTSVAEVLNISLHGIWLHVRRREYFLGFDEHPWFQEARVSEIHNVRLLRGHHLHWPDLDVDLELESLEHPERYPLMYRKSNRVHHRHRRQPHLSPALRPAPA